MHPPQATPFPSLSLPSESFSQHQGLSPPCRCRSPFILLCSPWRYFFPPLQPLPKAGSPRRPSPAEQGGSCKTKGMGFVSSILTFPLALPRCISLDVRRTHSTHSTRQPCSSISHTLTNSKLEEKPINQMGSEDWIRSVLVLMETILHCLIRRNDHAQTHRFCPGSTWGSPARMPGMMSPHVSVWLQCPHMP